MRGGMARGRYPPPGYSLQLAVALQGLGGVAVDGLIVAEVVDQRPLATRADLAAGGEVDAAGHLGHVVGVALLHARLVRRPGGDVGRGRDAVGRGAGLAGLAGRPRDVVGVVLASLVESQGEGDGGGSADAVVLEDAGDASQDSLDGIAEGEPLDFLVDRQRGQLERRRGLGLGEVSRERLGRLILGVPQERTHLLAPALEVTRLLGLEGGVEHGGDGVENVLHVNLLSLFDSVRVVVNGRRRHWPLSEGRARLRSAIKSIESFVVPGSVPTT